MLEKKLRLNQKQKAIYDEFVSTFKQNIVNSVNSSEVIEALDEIPAEERNESLYAELAGYMGAKMISYIPKKFQTQTLQNCLCRHASLVFSGGDYVRVKLNDNAGEFLYFPQVNAFVSRGDLESAQKYGIIQKNSYS